MLLVPPVQAPTAVQASAQVFPPPEPEIQMAWATAKRQAWARPASPAQSFLRRSPVQAATGYRFVKLQRKHFLTFDARFPKGPQN